MKKFLTATTAIIIVATAAAFAQTPPTPDPKTAATASQPRILDVQGKKAKIWGVPRNQHFTANRLFPKFWQRCPTGLVRADLVTDPAILKKYKAKNIDHLYHFVCLEEEPTTPAS